MPDGTAPSPWGADKKDVIFMSYYVARVGELIIKPEYRKDFGHMFFAEYDNVKDKGLFNYIAQFEVNPEYSMDFLQLRYWNHNVYKKEWLASILPAIKYLPVLSAFTTSLIECTTHPNHQTTRLHLSRRLFRQFIFKAKARVTHAF